jgi:hypothetical protein
MAWVSAEQEGHVPCSSRADQESFEDLAHDCRRSCGKYSALEPVGFDQVEVVNKQVDEVKLVARGGIDDSEGLRARRKPWLRPCP